MKIPLSWLREFTAIPLDISVAEIEDAFVRVGFEVESIDVLGGDIQGPLVVAQVLSIEELTEHKKPIRYVGLDCGEGQTRFVICGARNFSVGDRVVAALPGAILPGDFAISARETYGRISDGMICSARELRISDDHTGIIILPADAAIGADATQLLEVNDVVVDLSILADRGYALSARGLAREVASSLGLQFTDPVHLVDSSKYEINNAGVQVSIDDKSAASVIYMRTISNFDLTAQTPLWMSRRIEKCGMRSISLAVDITNYVMLELGQPLHAFDRDKVSGSLHIRRANDDAFLTTLDGQKRQLDPDDLVVADETSPLALAGTMGGESSEVTSSTTSIALEAARFDPISIARNSRRHKLSSEASRRLERAVDPSLAELASARAVDFFIQLGGASHIGSAKDGEPRYAPIISFDPRYVSTLLGTEISAATVAEKLLVIGCDLDQSNPDSWKVDPPSWRSDLVHPADLVEEVGRLVGYDKITPRLPIGKKGARLTQAQSRKRNLGLMLANVGFTEVMNSPFVSPEINDLLGFEGDRAKAFRIANPMSEDFPLLRTHLLPGLLIALQRNLGRGAKDPALFEIGTIFRNTTQLAVAEEVPTSSRPTDAQLAQIYQGVPQQPIHIGAVVAGNTQLDGWWGKGRAFDWSDAISMAIRLVEETGNTPRVIASNLAPWHTGRCAEILVGDVVVGHAGELHPRVVTALNLPARSCAFVVVLSAIPFHEVNRAVPVWTMPAAIQDISLIVDHDVPAADVEAALIAGAGELLESIQLFDRYDQLGDGKVSLAYSLTFRAPDRTLTAAEVSEFRTSAAASALEKCGAVVRV
jgi:phenylalanyl-tRNA synthetase beta chain